MSTASLIVSGWWFLSAGLLALLASEANASWMAKWCPCQPRKRCYRPAWWYGSVFFLVGCVQLAAAIWR